MCSIFSGTYILICLLVAIHIPSQQYRVLHAQCDVYCIFLVLCNHSLSCNVRIISYALVHVEQLCEDVSIPLITFLAKLKLSYMRTMIAEWYCVFTHQIPMRIRGKVFHGLHQAISVIYNPIKVYSNF